MDSNRASGIGFVLLGIGALSSAVTTAVSGAASSLIVPTGMAIAGLCLSGMGAGMLLGRLETTTGTASRRSAALIAAVAIVAFAIGAAVALG
jgi:hypothetical protein